MTIKSELDRQRLSYSAFRYDSGTGMFQGYDGSSWKYLDKLRYNSGTSLFEGWNGTSWGSIGGGLTITPINPTFSSPLAVGKHYLLDMTTASGDVTLSLPAGASRANIKIMVFANTATSYRLILQANGADTIYLNGTTNATLRVSPANYWLELGWAPSPRAYWVAESAGDLNAEITARQNADSTLQSNIDAEVTARMAADGVQGPGTVPLGGLVAVMPNIDVVIAWQPPATGEIKDGFMRADGTAITSTHKGLGCKLTVGTVLPNLTAKYLRGNITSGATGGANTVTIASANLPTHTHGVGTLANAAEAAHTHTKSGGVSAEGAHYHASTALSGNLVNAAELAHTHSSALPAHRHFIKSRSTTSAGSHNHGVVVWHGGDNVHSGGASTIAAANGTANTPVSFPSDGSHPHSWGGSWSNDTSSQVASPEGDGSGNTYEDTVGYWAVSGTRTTSAGSTHNHIISGHTGAVCAADGTTAATHTHADTIAYGAGSSHNHVISGSTDNGGFANTALNNEPAYVEVVWVIRVK